MNDTEIKFIKKYMRAAKQFGEDQNPCYSRKIGAYIIDPVTNKVKGTGYNGPPRKTPHCTDPDYLREVVWPQLTHDERFHALHVVSDNPEEFVNRYQNCQQCPRRIIGAASGNRYEICSCIHAECNAIINASQELFGCWLFLWGGAPCWECAKMIVNAGIHKIFCTESGYAYTSRVHFLLKVANVDIRFYTEQELLTD